MTIVGQIGLLTAFAGSGYAAFACVTGAWTRREALCRGGRWAGLVSLVALTFALGVLGWALCHNDFGFAYVAEYSSRLLPWYYAISALWVGQAGSLLLWAWLLGILSLPFLRRSFRSTRAAATFTPTPSEPEPDRLSTSVFGLLMGYLAYLTATMVFAADPMQPSVAPPIDGTGLSPLLRHPAMLIHPPVVFLGYAAWAVPCALTLAALAEGGLDQRWLQQVRPWALFAWAVLGSGILLGAQWSYEELGWGGYWAWDPVENASLIPWLTGTAFLHTLMTYRSRGILKRTVAALAILTFGLCNFATFLTRSGIFSSLHAFSRSPIGWLFLVLMFVLGFTGLALIFLRRSLLRPDRPIVSLLSGEAIVVISTTALLLLAGLVTGGTLFVALSEALVGRRIVIGPEFYNNTLIATGLVLVAAMAPAPLLEWGSAPSPARRKALAVAAISAGLGVAGGAALGVKHLLTLTLSGIAVGAVTSLAGRLVLDLQRRRPERFGRRLATTLRAGRRTYAGFVCHLGFYCLAVGVAGSSLGSVRSEFDLAEGETVSWADRSIQFSGLTRDRLPDKLIVAAELKVVDSGGVTHTLRPAQHLYRIANLDVWTTEAAIQPLWSGDFYTILHNGDGSKAHFTFVFNPLMRCVWCGGWLIGLGALAGLWPERSARIRSRESQPGWRPAFARKRISASQCSQSITVPVGRSTD
jgi:cytochrome c-type biogenesis protein CcmF